MFHIPFSVMAFLLLGTGIAFAQPEGNAAEQMAKDKNRPSLIERLDKNGDGGITLEESRQSAGERFDALDTDKNGILSKAEVQARKVAMEEKMKERAESSGKEAGDGKKKRSSGMERLFAKLDQDGDGQVTKDQYVAESDGKHATMDTDKDGKVTQAEIDTHREKMRERMRERKKERTSQKGDAGN